MEKQIPPMWVRITQLIKSNYELMRFLRSSRF